METNGTKRRHGNKKIHRRVGACVAATGRPFSRSSTSSTAPRSAAGICSSALLTRSAMSLKPCLDGAKRRAAFARAYDLDSQPAPRRQGGTWMGLVDGQWGRRPEAPEGW